MTFGLLSAQVSIHSLLTSIGLRPGDSEEISLEIVSFEGTRNDLRRMILNLLADSKRVGWARHLRLHVAAAILQMLDAKQHTAETIWLYLARIWKKYKFNIAVASHRLKNALANLSIETSELIPFEVPSKATDEAAMAAVA